MSRNSKPHVREFRDNYAPCTDFCEVFRRNTTHLYLLAFLLTANHQEAQECFVGAMDKAFAGRNVFKGWEESWSKRCLIEYAIGAIIFQPGRREAQRVLWLHERGENKLRTFLDAVTQLKSTERLPKQRVWRRSDPLETWPVTPLRSLERRRRGLRGGTGWVCC